MGKGKIGHRPPPLPPATTDALKSGAKVLEAAGAALPFGTGAALDAAANKLRLFGDGFDGSAVKGSNAGAKGLKDPAVKVARQKAKASEKLKVDWKHPEKTLDRMTQFDSEK